MNSAQTKSEKKSANPIVDKTMSSLGLWPRRLARTQKMAKYMGIQTHLPEMRDMNRSGSDEWQLFSHSSKAESKLLSVFII